MNSSMGVMTDECVVTNIVVDVQVCSNLLVQLREDVYIRDEV